MPALRIRAGLLGCVTIAATVTALLVPASVASAASVTPAATTAALCHPSSGHAASLPSQGSFVIGEGRVWEVAGCALLYVSSWTPFGGGHPITAISTADFLAAVGNKIADGVFIRTLQDGRVYRTVGGAPVYVSTWAAFGGPQASVPIDGADLSHAGLGFPWFAVSSSPSSLTPQFVRTQVGRVYEIAHGTPLYVTSWASLGGPRPTVLVDETAIDRAGDPGPWRFLHRYLADGDFLEAIFFPGDIVEMYVIAGGAPIYLPTLANLPAVDVVIKISHDTVARAGSGVQYDHLRAQPVDGTFLYGVYGSTGGPGIPSPLFHTYWTSGGAAVPVTNAASCPGGGVAIEDEAVVKAGTGGRYDHLAALPAHPPTPPC